MDRVIEEIPKGKTLMFYGKQQIFICFKTTENLG